jgi:hypothetical protein
MTLSAAQSWSDRLAEASSTRAQVGKHYIKDLFSMLVVNPLSTPSPAASAACLAAVAMAAMVATRTAAAEGWGISLAAAGTAATTREAVCGACLMGWWIQWAVCSSSESCWSGRAELRPAVLCRGPDLQLSDRVTSSLLIAPMPSLHKLMRSICFSKRTAHGIHV